MTSASGGQRSIQLSYGCVERAINPGPKAPEPYANRDARANAPARPRRRPAIITVNKKARGILWINGNLKDRLDSREDLQDQIVWGVAVQFSVPRQPIQGPHLVGKNDTGNAGGRGDRHFERRRLCLVRHRACEYQARGHIVIERG